MQSVRLYRPFNISPERKAAQDAYERAIEASNAMSNDMHVTPEVYIRALDRQTEAAKAYGAVLLKEDKAANPQRYRK